MTHVVPAIIPHSYADIKNRMAQVRTYVERVQIDIMDGDFAPEPSWPYVGNEDNMFERVISEEEPMPYWKEVNFEVDLMVTRPADVLDNWIDAGARGLIIHVESEGDVGEMIRHIRHRSGGGDLFLHTSIGLAFTPSTSLSVLEPYMDRADFVQCMGNDKIGFHGVDLDERVYDILHTLRERYPEHGRAVDIGVNEETAPRLVEAGCTKLVSGSAIFDADNIGAQVAAFQNL